MSMKRNTLIFVASVFCLLTLAACTREITTVQEVNPGASNCFECHSDQDGMLASKQIEWSYSNHGIGAYVGYAGNRSGCSECHSGSGFVADLNGEEDVPYGTSIGCWACHEPHTTGDFGLRVTEAQTLLNGVSMDIGSANLCVNCHHARRSVYEYVVADAADSTTIGSSHWGPHHGPQGDMFFGSNGFEFDGVTYDTAAPTMHVTNDFGGACLSCHFNANSAADLGGHSFNMTNADDDMNVDGCNNCHTDVEDFNVYGIPAAIDVLAEELHVLLEAEGLVDADGHPINGSRSSYVKVGALWNFMMWEEDRSHGVHNPDYIHDLLESSIAVMEAK